VVPREQPAHVLPHRLDDPGALVTEDHGPAIRAQQAVGQVNIGMADPGRRHPHEHLVSARRVEQHRFDGDRPSRLTQDNRLHHDRAGLGGRPGLSRERRQARSLSPGGA
jgi:hypothetical protein